MVTLYSNDCPRCRVVKSKLDQKSISYNIFDNIVTMVEIGITEVPKLKVNNELLDFSDAVEWINKQ